MASPHAAGCAALLIQGGEATTPDALENRLETSTVSVTDPTNGLSFPRIDCSMPDAANAPPVASFSFSTTNLLASFTDTSTDSDGTIVSWSWSFGDGASSSDQNPSHTYATAGTYTVSLTVTDDMGATDTATASVTVTEPALGSMYIASISTEINRDRVTRTGTVDASFVIVDNNGNLVEGATVEGLFDGDLSGTDFGLTDATGTAVLTSDPFTVRPRDLGICAVDVTHPTLAYDPASNADPSFACPATIQENTVTGFVLVDADTDADLFELTDGITLDLAALPHNLNVRAEVSDGVESVLFSVDPQGFAREENIPPYSLFGDVNIDDYLGGTFDNGAQVLTATPYSADNQGGDEGTALSITLNVINGTMSAASDAASPTKGEALTRGADVPEEFELGSAYPNPFNPQTTIRFAVPEAAHVTVKVYDALGRVVSTLIDGTVESGHHEVMFDAGNLPSGTYLYRLESPSGSFTKTMLLLK